MVSIFLSVEMNEAELKPILHFPPSRKLETPEAAVGLDRDEADAGATEARKRVGQRERENGEENRKLWFDVTEGKRGDRDFQACFDIF